MSDSKRPDILQGTLDLLILRILEEEPAHGWEIARRIRQRSEEVLRVQQGSLYPALYRLADRGWVRSERALSDEGRPVKVYSLTAAGRRQLQEERDSWERLSAAVDLILDEG